ncbi:13755_t:CDS:2 [Gigaspora rosea]|nr:13755_t:CDS:2 [Gigaspora rosea]
MSSLAHAYNCPEIVVPCSVFSTIFSSVPVLYAQGQIPNPSSNPGSFSIRIDQKIAEKSTYNTKIDYILQSGDYFASTQYWVRRIGIYDIYQTDNIGFPSENLSSGHLGECFNLTIIISEADQIKFMLVHRISIMRHMVMLEINANPGFLPCDKTNISTSYFNASSLSVNFEEWHPKYIKFYTRINEKIPTTMYTFLEYILDTDDIFKQTSMISGDIPPGTTDLLRNDNVGKLNLDGIGYRIYIRLFDTVPFKIRSCIMFDRSII